MVQAECRDRGDNGRRKCSRRRHAAQGTETSGGSWWVGVRYFQVDSTPLRVRRWVEIVTERCCDYERLLIGEQ